MSTFSDTFISTSDLQKNTKKCFEGLDTMKKKIILSNNKPRAVLVSIDEYEKLSRGKNAFPEILPTKAEISAYKNSSHGKDGIEAFSFLESIK